MNLEQLRAAGAFIPEPKKVEVEWNGNKFDVHIKQISFADMERFASGYAPNVAILSACVLLGEDKKPMSVEEAANLSPDLAVALVNAANKAHEGN